MDITDFDINEVLNFDSGVGEGGSEVVANEGDLFVVTNGEEDRIDVYSATSGALSFSMGLDGIEGFDGVQSVDIRGGVIAAAIAREDNDLGFPQAGLVNAYSAEDGSLIASYTVGNLPDMLTFSKDGSMIFVANEGERGDEEDPSQDFAAGSISVIELESGEVSTFGFEQYDDMDGDEDFDDDDLAMLRAMGIRTFPDSAPSQDFEPEYISEAEDGRLYVSIQENNAIAVFDLETMGWVDLFSAGIRDYSLAGSGFDPSDEGGNIGILNYDVLGWNMPDAIATATIEGQTYILTANEGDSRDFDETRIEDLDLDPDAYPDADDLQDELALGRLQADNLSGDTDADGDIDQIYAFGGRSFTILNSDGDVVFDSGDDFEQIIAAFRVPGAFNNDDYRPGDSDPAVVDDNRSDAKGPEPEAIAVGEIDDQVFAFIGMERTSEIFIYDITNPELPVFVEFINSAEFGNFGPEVIKFIGAGESSDGQVGIAVSYEISGTTAVYELGIDGFGIEIGDIQGEGERSDLVGMRVSTNGIVTAVDSNGFYFQDPDGDGNARTSDALFVFTGGSPDVEVGDDVNVVGTVSEYVSGGSNQPVTQLGNAEITVRSSGNELPAATLIGPDGILPPTASTLEGIEFWNSLESMLLTYQSPVLVAPYSQFREFYAAVSDGEGNVYGTNFSERGTLNIDGGEGTLGFTNVTGGDFNPEIVSFQSDFSGVSNFYSLDGFDADVGAQLPDVTGVLSFGFGVYELLVTEPLDMDAFVPSALEPESTDLAGSDTKLTIATFNVLNLDPNEDDGDTDIADGRYTNLATDIVENLGGPDILVLQEVQDDSGEADDGTVSASENLARIVAAIEEAGGPSYTAIDNSFIENNMSGGAPGANIRNVILYNADRVDLVDGSVQTIESEAFTDARLPLIADFEFNGETYTVVNNHFSSKGGSTDLLGTTQPPVNGSAFERAAQAEAVAEYVEGLGADANVVVLGDLNEFEFEEPLDPLYDAGLYNLWYDLPEEERYSYIFNGNSQALDHIFVSQNLRTGATLDAVHSNAEFAGFSGPYSDHDPLIVEIDTQATYTLQLLHFGDPEAGLLASETAPRIAALVDLFEDQYVNSITLSAGDNYIPGPFLTAGYLSTGQFVDIEILNAMGVQASAVGNHEFDLGTGVFADAVSAADFPYITANLDFSADGSTSGLYIDTTTEAGLEFARDLAGRIVPNAVIEEGGELIGVVGATTQILETISSTGAVDVLDPEEDDMQALAEILQPAIDDLRDQGVNKIVLVSHLQQIELEEALAPLLEGVDIIVAGGSNTLLADSNDELVDFPGHPAEADGGYPIVTAGADGAPTLIVNTDNEYTYLGRLVVEFDQDGELILDSLDDMVNGAYAGTDEVVAEAYGVEERFLNETAYAEGTRGDAVFDLIEPVQEVIESQGGNIFGYSDVYLEGARGAVRTQETNLGNLTADANAAALRARDDSLEDGQVIVSIKNGGGIRAAIGTVTGTGSDVEYGPPPPDGGVAELEIGNALRFNNRLVALDTDPAGLKTLLERGVSGIKGATEGRFPQVGGVRFSFDQDLEVGERVLDVALVAEDGTIIPLFEDGELVDGVSEDLSITVVTLNFLGTGGDGYPFPDVAENVRYLTEDGVVDTEIVPEGDGYTYSVEPDDALGEQQAFQEYLAAQYGTQKEAFARPDTAIEADTRIQNEDFRESTVFEADTGGGAGDDTIDGTGGDDVIDAGAGNDLIRSGTGNDKITTGEGEDIVQGTLAEHAGDTIADFEPGADSLRILGANVAGGDVEIAQTEESTVITFEGGGELTLEGDYTDQGFLFLPDGDNTIVIADDLLTGETLEEGEAIPDSIETGLGQVGMLLVGGEDGRDFELTFDDSVQAAGYDNSLIAYEIDGAGNIRDVRLVAANVKDVTEPVEIEGVDAGWELHFAVVQNGANLGITDTSTVQLIDLGTDIALLVDGVLSTAEVFVSHDTGLNPDGLDHVIAGADGEGNAVIGFEDLTGGGDADYQDVVFEVAEIMPDVLI